MADIDDMLSLLKDKYVSCLTLLPHKVHKINYKSDGYLKFYEFEIKNGYHNRTFYIIENQTLQSSFTLDIDSLEFTKKQEKIKKFFKHNFYLANINPKNKGILNMDKPLLNHIIHAINDINPVAGLELVEEISAYLIKKGGDLKKIKKNLVTHTNRLFQHLHSNDIRRIEHEITVNNKSSDEEFDKWFRKIEKIESKFEIKGYCDLDYYPYLFNNYLLIEDVAADKLLYCEFSNKDNFTWFISDSRSVDDDEENTSDIYYESNVYLTKIIDKTKKDINRLLVVENGEIVFVNNEVDYLNLLQSFIINELEENKEIPMENLNLSFKDLLNNYTTSKEMWNIQERAFFDLLSELEYRNGILTYEDFCLIDPEDYIIHHEEDKYFTNERIIEHLESLSMKVQLDVNHKKEILKYLEEELEVRYPHAKSGLNKLKEDLFLNVTTKNNFRI